MVFCAEPETVGQLLAALFVRVSVFDELVELGFAEPANFLPCRLSRLGGKTVEGVFR